MPGYCYTCGVYAPLDDVMAWCESCQSAWQQRYRGALLIRDRRVSRPTALGLCAGGGGTDLGLEQAGFTHSALVEIDADCCRTLRANRPGWQVRECSIDEVSGTPFAGQVDLLSAGLPCFAAGTMVLTAEGYKPIETVTTADLVLTHQGKWQPVTSVMVTEDAPLWEVKAGQKITTTAAHPFYAREQSWIPGGREKDWHKVRYIAEPMWVAASDLRSGTHRIGHVLPPVTTPQITDPAWWWLAGRYLADGWWTQRKKTGSGNPVQGDQGQVTIGCGRGKEDELRKHLDLSGLHATESPERTVIKFHIQQQEFYQFCQQFGHGAASKQPSSAALSLPAGLAAELLDGWLAGDGYWEDLHGWSGTTISKAMALGMVMIAHRARGVMASIRACKLRTAFVIEGRKVSGQQAWRVDIPRRNQKHVVEGDQAWRLITSSAPLQRNGTVYNLSVTEDESYIADGVIVHNCTPHSRGGRQLGAGDERHLWDEALRIISEAAPRAVMLETANAILTPKFSVERAGTLHRLHQLGYQAWWEVADASRFGVPQRRQRALLIAFREPGAVASFTWPKPSGAAPTVGDTLYPLIAARNWPGAGAWRDGAQGLAPVLVGGSKKHGGADLSGSQGKAAWRKLGVNGMGIADEAPGADGKYARSASKIFDAADGVMLTTAMAQLIQGFPGSWEITGRKTAAYRQVGNALPPPVAAAFGHAVRIALQHGKAAA